MNESRRKGLLEREKVRASRRSLIGMICEVKDKISNEVLSRAEDSKKFLSFTFQLLRISMIN
jgi:hypothetical protein